uniref:Uncharacterized protein n=1 Tax=Arundo donax TaxID=35708 RepID=A0A0A8YM02_ARUDO
MPWRRCFVCAFNLFVERRQ